MLISYKVFKNDFDLSNGLINSYHAGFYILFDRIIIPEASYNDYVYVLYNPQLGHWDFAKLSSTTEPNISVCDFFRNYDLLVKYNNKNEHILLNYVSNPSNSNRITLPPQHLLSNGLKISMDLDGEKIANMELVAGFFNNRIDSNKYSNIIPVLERFNPSTRVTAPKIYAQLLEEINKVPVPDKAKTIRKIFDNLIKIVSHISTFKKLIKLASNDNLKRELLKISNKLGKLISMYAENEYFPNFIVIGGVKRSLPKGWRREARIVLWELEAFLKKLETSILHSRTFVDITGDSGKISKKEALEYGLTGPILRASGIDIDFQELNAHSTLGMNGSTWDRFFVRIEDTKRQIKFIYELFDTMPGGIVIENNHHSIYYSNHCTAEGQINNFMLSLQPIRIPQGDYFGISEASGGLVSIFIRSKNDIKPHYMSIRTGAKTNILAYSKSLNQNIRSFEYFAASLDINGAEISGNMYE